MAQVRQKHSDVYENTSPIYLELTSLVYVNTTIASAVSN